MPYARFKVSGRAVLVLAGITFAICLLSGIINLIPYRDQFYNSDFLVFPAMYRDFVNGISLSNWVILSPSFIFPDMSLYFVINALVPNFHVAVVLVAIAQLSLFVGGLLFVSITLQPRNTGIHALILFGGALYFLILRFSSLQFSEPLANPDHIGTFIAAIWVFGLWLRIVAPTSPPKRWAAPRIALWMTIEALIFLCTLSDLLFIIQAVLPVFVCLLFLTLTQKLGGRRLAVYTVLLALPGGVGAIAQKWIFNQARLGIILSVSRATITGEARDILQFVRTLPPDQWLWILFGLIFIVVCAVIVFRAFKQRSMSALSYEMSVLFFLAVVVINFFVLIPVRELFTRRYALPVLLFPLLYGWPFVFGALTPLSQWLNGTAGRVVLTGCAVVLCVIQIPTLTRIQTLSVYTDYYPPLAQCMDEHAADLPIKSGLSNYFQARYLTMLSRQHLTVAQITPQLSPYLLYNNITEYNRPVDFIIMDPDATRSVHIDPKTVTSKFGEPSAQFKCQNSQIFVYDRPADTAFRNQFDPN